MAQNPKHSARHAASSQPAGAAKNSRQTSRHGHRRSEADLQSGQTVQQGHASPQQSEAPHPYQQGQAPQQQQTPRQQAPAGAQQVRAPHNAAGYYQPRNIYAESAPQAVKPAWSPQAERKKATSHSKAPVILVVFILLAIGAGGAYLWLNRPVSFTLNGTETEMAIGSTLSQIKEAQAPDIVAGNLLSVNGNVIQEGGGTQFSANVDGQDLSEDDENSFRLKGGENITLSDGTDTTEAYDVQSHEDIQPKLKMEGSEGAIFYVKQWGKVGSQETIVGQQSGETYTGVTQEAQDCIVTRQSINPDNDEKLVALTFDDGPSTYTDSYLDILDQYGIKATFCLIGEQVSSFATQVNRIKDDGCEIASHTWDHKQLTAISADEISQELSQSFQVITDTAGVQTSLLRQPYGSMNSDVWLASGGQMTVAAFWTQDSMDWARPGVDAIVAKSTVNMAPGSIILMHDGGGDRSQDLDALPRIIETWQNAGYRFVTLSELMQSDSSIPDEVCTQYEAMPADAVWPTELSEDSVSNAIP